MAPAGNSVSLVRLAGSSSRPAAFNCLATCGSCWGIHMPSSAWAAVLRMASAIRVLCIGIYRFQSGDGEGEAEYPQHCRTRQPDFDDAKKPAGSSLTIVYGLMCEG